MICTNLQPLLWEEKLTHTKTREMNKLSIQMVHQLKDITSKTALDK